MSNPEPYLILHKVRGEPAFDIAICCTEEDGWGTYDDPAPWWIIPTSGHRAYPIWEVPVTDLMAGEKFDPYTVTYRCAQIEWPQDWPDHYTLNSIPAPSISAEDLLADLGLAAKPRTIKRRV